MRRIALPLVLALLPLALGPAMAAPAPLPRRSTETPAQKQGRLMAEYRRRLDELGVKWRVQDGRGGPWVVFRVSHPRNNSGMGGSFGVADGDLARTLREVIEEVEAYFRGKDRL